MPMFSLHFLILSQHSQLLATWLDFQPTYCQTEQGGKYVKQILNALFVLDSGHWTADWDAVRI